MNDDDLIKPEAPSNSKDPSKANKNAQVEPPKSKTKSNKSTSNDKSKTKKTTASVNQEALFNAKPIPKLDTTKKQKTKISPIIFSIVILLLIAASIWNYYQQKIVSEDIQSIKADTKKDIASQNSQVKEAIKSNNQVVTEINQLKQSIKNLATNNNDLSLQLLSAQEKIKSLSGRRKQDWMLAEVEYLINIAEQKLSLQKDKNTAIQLLKTADQRLIEIADQSHFRIREAIAKDISTLNLIQESDVTGIVVALNALEGKINDLELLALKFEDVEEETLPTENTKQQTDESFTAKLDKIYQRFISEFIVVKNHAEAPQPLMTPKQRGNLNLNIQLALQQAQIAAIQGNEALYLINIEKSKNWISTYFAQSEKSNAITNELEVLKNKIIDVRYPAHLETTKMIKNVNKDQLYQWLDNNPNTTDIENKEAEPSL